LAAALLVAVLLRLEVRAEAGQFILRWGPEQAEHTPPLGMGDRQPSQRPANDLAERLQVLSDTLHALVSDIDQREAGSQANFAVLRQHVDVLDRFMRLHWSETERSDSRWRTVQNVPTDKGDENP
jgi:hypothetical protein